LGHHIELQAADGHRLGAYRANPQGEATGGIVVLQEIFGVNHHIRSICDRLAAEGFVVVAPALFDRITPDFESGYSDDEVTRARAFISKVDWDAMLLDVEAAAGALTDSQPKSVVGFCLGGSVAYFAAVRQDGFSASVCFYGGKIVAYADEAPRCPTQMHFGEQDHGIPLSDVEIIREKRPDCDIHIYPAGHGFNCDERGSYHQESAALAWERTLAFIRASARDS
jgi:carboxymethylenebutenolidase